MTGNPVSKELLGRNISERGMSSGTVVQGLDIWKDGEPRCVSGAETAAVGKGFCFEAGEKGFAGGVVVAFAFRAHALLEIEREKSIANFRRGVLAPMKRHSSG